MSREQGARGGKEEAGGGTLETAALRGAGSPGRPSPLPFKLEIPDQNPAFSTHGQQNHTTAVCRGGGRPTLERQRSAHQPSPLQLPDLPHNAFPHSGPKTQSPGAKETAWGGTLLPPFPQV